MKSQKKICSYEMKNLDLSFEKTQVHSPKLKLQSQCGENVYIEYTIRNQIF